ncbi:MAG: 4'-phosphopantetheinyl transferase family protein [Haloechinothrix sp.]
MATDRIGASTASEVWWSAPLPPAREFLALLDDTENQRYQAYRKQADQRRFLTGRVLAKTVIGGRLGVPASEVVFDATCEDCGKPHGRPTISCSAEPLELSISHSGDRVGLAVTAGAPVGLDVENADRDSIDGLVDYALNERERAAIDALGESARQDAFFVYWARKEALMKASGQGLRVPLRSLTLSDPGQPVRLVESGHPALRPDTTRLIDLNPGAGYRASLALLTGGPIDVAERWWTP